MSYKVRNYFIITSSLHHHSLSIAWDLSVSLMELGEVAQVKTVPRFAYGFIGRSVVASPPPPPPPPREQHEWK